MSVFNSVLVGVDLLQTDRHDSSSFSLPVAEAIKYALWLAEKASASLTFFAALDIPEGSFIRRKRTILPWPASFSGRASRRSIILSICQEARFDRHRQAGQRRSLGRDYPRS